MCALRLATPQDAAGIAHVHVESWHVAFSGFYPALVTQRGDQSQQRLALWQKILPDEQDFTYVACDEQGTIVGFAQGGAARSLNLPTYESELHRLYVMSEAQGQHLGTRLIKQVALHLHNAGYTGMLVAAYAANTPARGFYEHLGAQFIDTVPQESAGLDTTQVVYGWEDVAALLERIEK